MKSVVSWHRQTPDGGGRKFTRRSDAEHETTLAMMRANIDAHLATGWNAGDLLAFTNFDFEHRGVVTRALPRLTRVAYFSKWVATLAAMDLHPSETIYAHDPDVWPIEPFNDAPLPPGKSIGFAQYHYGVQGGVAFIRPEARHIVTETIKRGEADRYINDEHLLNGLRIKHAGVWHDLDGRWNVGRTRWRHRLWRVERPIMALHLLPFEAHPLNEQCPPWLIDIFRAHGIWHEQPVEAA